jgi:hypothetical protein
MRGRRIVFAAGFVAAATFLMIPGIAPPGIMTA